MLNLKPFIVKSFNALMFRRTTLIVLSAAFVFIGGLLKGIDALLETKHSPNGMNSFQTTLNREQAELIRSIWQQPVKNEAGVQSYTRIDIANLAFVLDYLFLLVYGCLLYLFIVRSKVDPVNLTFQKKYIPLLPLGAMIADGTENLMSGLFFNGAAPWSYILPVITAIKFVLIVVSIAHMPVLLMQISRYAKEVFQLISTFRIVVISMLVLYLALWYADQGQDLLVNLNSHPVGPIVFFTAITVLASLHWHLPKFLSVNTSYTPPATFLGWIKALFTDSVKYNQIAQGRYVLDSDIARAFGVATFLIPAFAVLNVMDKFNIMNLYPNYFFIGSLLLLAVSLRYNWIDNAYLVPKNRPVFHTILVVLLVALISLHFVNNLYPNLIWLFLGFVILALAFLIVASIRHHFSMRSLHVLRLAPLIMGFATLFACVFIIANIWPLSLASIGFQSAQYSTISIFVLGLLFYILFFSGLLFLGRTKTATIRGNQINVTGIFLVIAFLFAMMVDNRFHDVSLVPAENVSAPPSLEKYFDGWLAERDTAIAVADSVHPYPIFIVSTYGGGIRAAAWTSLAIATLDSCVRTRTGGLDNFQNHVLAYSGASGGTIGASVMCALRKQDRKVTVGELAKFYSNDFLSPVMIGLIGRDFFSSTLGLSLPDRAVLQEQVWEHHMQKDFQNSYYGQPISSIWNGDSYQVPLLFANTIQVEKGIKGVVAPVSFDQSIFPAAISVVDLIRKEEAEHASENHGHKLRDLKLSTAAFFSARFPFISPAGRVNGGNHFLDGGIYENAGAETAGELERVIRRIVAKKKIDSKVKIIVVSLKNSPPVPDQEVTKNLFELSAPLLALVNNVDGNAWHADEVNRFAAGGNFVRLHPQKTDLQSKDHQAILPLGWQLSERAIWRLRINLSKPDTYTSTELSKVIDAF